MSDLVRVGDRIEYGQGIPANVVRLRDADGNTEMAWWRVSVEPLAFYYNKVRPRGGALGTSVESLLAEWFPMTVLEVDPEPQHAESGPLVLTLPAVPDGAVALVGERYGEAIRFERADGEGWWRRSPQHVEVRLWQILGDLGSVTVETAPPREPRIWEQLDAVPEADGLPDAVDLIEPDRSPLRFVRTTGLRGVPRYIKPGHPEISFTLTELRGLGKVREVLS